MLEECGIAGSPKNYGAVTKKCQIPAFGGAIRVAAKARAWGQPGHGWHNGGEEHPAQSRRTRVVGTCHTAVVSPDYSEDMAGRKPHECLFTLAVRW